MNKLKDLTYQRFGRLEAICPTEKRKSGNVVWLCRCDCGNLIEIMSPSLILERTKSCGCLRKEKSKKRITKLNFIHGDAITGKKARLYNIWNHMKKRCLDLNAYEYKYYGERGISVCEEWIKNYQAFKFWALLNGYADNLTIDRIDNDGNYEPLNCQWITRSENSKKPKHKIKKGVKI